MPAFFVNRAAFLRSSLLVAVINLGLNVPVSAATGDEHWDPQFGNPGVTNLVFALGSYGNRLLVGGLSQASGATNVAIHAWDGSNWSALDYASGSTMVVQDFVDVGNELYVAGVFTRIGGVLAPGLGRWNGAAWSGVGGFAGAALTVASSGNNLFVGGAFTNVGGQIMTNIARWDGANWHRLGNGLGPYSSFGSLYVYDILPVGNEVYAAGNFSTSGGVAVRYLGRWNGIGWSEVGGGIDGEARALWREGNDIYVGGSFTTAGGITVNRIAKWNGVTWSPLGSGMDATVESIAFYGGHLYAVGSFLTAGGVPAARIARWDGLSWSPVGNGLSAAGSKLHLHESKLYVGGNFVFADDILVNGVACWDGARWTGLGAADRIAGVSTVVRAFARDGNDLYVGGEFIGAGNIKAHRIAKWDGRNWSAMGTGLRGTNDATTTTVSAIAISGSNLYAGGIFTNAGGVAANNIARWNGSAWSPLADGVPGGVSAIATRGSEVFVGGTFTKSIGGQTAFNIAKWDGAGWSVLPGAPWAGTIGNFTVSALAIHGSDLFVGGNFFAGSLGGPQTTNIARHDGTGWRPLGTGVNSNVNAILVVGSDIYAAGRFTSASGVSANRIAKWNGATWSALGSGLPTTVNALTVIGTNLYAGGLFTTAGGMNAARVAKWDGTTWSPLGSGVYRQTSGGFVQTLASIGNDLYVGGTCMFAGTNRSYFIARWNDAIDFANPGRILLASPRRVGSAFRFTIDASGVQSYVIERTSDLLIWVPVFTNSVSPFDYTDLETHPRRFYRGVGR